MAKYSRLIAERIDLGPDLDPLQIYKAAPLHDVGKIGVPDHILLKPSSLTEDEFREMQRHAELGTRFCVTATARSCAWEARSR